MSMSDPIADMLTRVRNGQRVGFESVSMPNSHRKEAIAKVLQEEGYIGDFNVEKLDGNKANLVVDLRYFDTSDWVPIVSTAERAEERVVLSVRFQF